MGRWEGCRRSRDCLRRSPRFSALAVLDEHVGIVGVLGIACATIAVALLGYRSEPATAREAWLGLTLVSLTLQGVGAFVAKVVVTPSGPSALLVTSASVQVIVGAFLLRRSNASFPDLRPRLMRLTALILVLAAVATIGYLFALSQGPAAIIVPLVATSPALGGLLGAIVVKERLGRLQYSGIGLGLLAAVLLATQV